MSTHLKHFFKENLENPVCNGLVRFKTNVQLNHGREET